MTQLRSTGSRLIIRRGANIDVLRHLTSETGATHLYWNRLYEPLHIERDRRIKMALRADGLAVESHNGSLLFEPWQATKADGTPYRVFAPFWKARVNAGLSGSLHATPTGLPEVSPRVASLNPADLGLLPTIPWDVGLQATWQVGERAAVASLKRFIEASQAK